VELTIDEISILNVKPGDRIVLRLNCQLTRMAYDMLKNDIKKSWNLPDGVTVCIVENCSEIEIVREDINL